MTGGLGGWTVGLRHVDTSIPVGVLAHLLDGTRSLGRLSHASSHPLVHANLEKVPHQEPDACGHLLIVGDLLEPLKVLVHADLGLGSVQEFATGLHEVTQTLQILHLVGKRLFSPADQELLATFVQHRLLDDLKLAQLANELDVAQHFALGHVFGLLNVGGSNVGIGGSGRIFESTFVLVRNLGSVFEFIFALGEEQSLERAKLSRRIKIGRLFC